MKTYTFTLVLGESPRINEEIAGQLFEAGCDDAFPGVRYGVSIVDFDREASSFSSAVTSAIADVEKANSQLRVCRIEPDDLVSMSEIARRSGKERQNISQMVKGTRGPRTFPPPVRAVATKSPLWSWAQVAEWLAAHNKLDREIAEQAEEIVRLNAEREHPSEKPEVQNAYVILVAGPVTPSLPQWNRDIHIKRHGFGMGVR